jgi:hypothetical protein
MIETPTLAESEIRRLGLPFVFVAVMDGTFATDQTAPGYSRGEFRRPRAYFQIVDALRRNVAGLEGLCPLWEENGEAIIGRLPDGRFVRFYYEDASEADPDAAIEVLGNNYQQFVTTVLIELSEADLFDKYGQGVADLLRYEHLPALRDLLGDWTEETGEARLAVFRDSLK